MAKNLLRSTALDILIRVGEGGGFSHLLIDHAIKNKGLSEKDQSLLTEMVYGTIQRKLTLEYFLAGFVDQKKKLSPWVKWLLYLSLYQMKYLDKVPDHAIIHESVEISKKRGHKGIASLVNGVLRSIQRKGFPDPAKITDPTKRISIETSHPSWLIERWIKMYGTKITEEMCQINLTHKPISVRVQPMKLSRQEAIDHLVNNGFDVEPSFFSGQGIIVNKGNILRSDLFKNGFLTIQDQSSMLVTEMLKVEKGMTILDACSAPGGKTTHIAEKMSNVGQIHAYDLHDKKAKLVTKKALELELSIISSKQADSRTLRSLHQEETFDRILLDAPCSGLGVLRSKPDIKYHKSEQDIKQLSLIQLELLESVSSLLKKDGKLLYSTCTVDKNENEKVIEEFLLKHPEYEIDQEFYQELPENLKDTEGKTKWGLQLFPHECNTDGFFLTRLKKNSQ
ncbi:16S rRNA (cytosine(967)-C(5))-methyltransferase RsmB [Aquibacillus halophilus]|uniref:16S rRNA (cytosine(967)-C(5))-methyltransferase n=1 Tax=Aquibacillus halophilus TaxID=930132 RepID=A0A6A8DA81_9BACI|nr:16S rRNA (cytosine(967)-C(5))-methyltransferase RsmB [Aquibacillus halophilus]MRH42210.1 16S rRNA (cytosine(967)-C(5))-methyltransferase RsmB [Aquibacillus halophilus]